MNANPASERGFTLIEVLAALLVFSLSIIGLTHAGTQSAQAVSVISEKSMASITADNALIKARLAPLKLGTQTGEETQMGQTFNYTLITSKTSVNGLFSLSVTISKDKSEQVILSRQAFRGAQ